jgi:hypothetical protein
MRSRAGVELHVPQNSFCYLSISASVSRRTLEPLLGTDNTNMRYLIFIVTDHAVVHLEEPPGAIQAWVEEGEERGIRVDGNRLRPPESATLVRIRDGKTLVTDGPFAETKEWIAGYDILECQDLAEAVDYVSRHPMARRGQIEIRPVWPM